MTAKEFIDAFKLRDIPQGLRSGQFLYAELYKIKPRLANWIDEQIGLFAYNKPISIIIYDAIEEYWNYEEL